MKSSQIFNIETSDYLLSLGISQKDIDKIKFKELKEKSIQILREVAELIKKEKFNDLEPYLRFSPSGDCMGAENHYINFGEITGGEECMDIEELFNTLKSLQTSVN